MSPWPSGSTKKQKDCGDGAGEGRQRLHADSALWARPAQSARLRVSGRAALQDGHDPSAASAQSCGGRHGAGFSQRETHSHRDLLPDPVSGPQLVSREVFLMPGNLADSEAAGDSETGAGHRKLGDRQVAAPPAARRTRMPLSRCGLRPQAAQ